MPSISNIAPYWLSQRPALVAFEPVARMLTPVHQPDGVASGRDGTGGSHPPTFRLSSVTDLIIDGGGSKITFADYCQFVDLLNCSRAQIVRFEFDLEPLRFFVAFLLLRAVPQPQLQHPGSRPPTARGLQGVPSFWDCNPKS